MKAIRSLILNNNLRILSGCIVVFCAILDLSFGAAYVAAGGYFTSMSSLYGTKQGSKSVGGFTIVSGICLILITGAIFWDLSKNQANKRMSFGIWMSGVVMVLLNFTCGILTAQVYTPAAVYLRQELNLSVSSVGGSIGNLLNFAAATTVFTFVTGLPATLYLFAVLNSQRQKIHKHNQEDSLSNNHAEPNTAPAGSQMEESQVEQVARNQSYNYNYMTEGVPQPLPPNLTTNSNPYPDYSYNSPGKESSNLESTPPQKQPIELQIINHSTTLQHNMSVVKQIEIQRSSYD